MQPTFRLTRIAPDEFGVNNFSSDGDLFSETTGAKTDVTRYTGDPDRPSVMKIKGVTIALGDGYTLGGGYYLDDSVVGVGEGAYEDYAVTEKVQYSLSFLYKIDLGTLIFIVYDQTNATIIHTAVITYQQWRSYERNFIVPEGCNTVRIKFLQANAHSSPFYIDNFSINGNVLITNPDDYRRKPVRMGTLHQTLSGRRVYDFNSIHYVMNLVWNKVTIEQYDALREALFSNEVLYFDDGNVPPLTETEYVYDNDTYDYTGITNPSATHKAYTDSGSLLPSAESDFESAEISTGNYQNIDDDDANNLQTTNPTAGNYLYHKFCILSGITYDKVQRIRINVKASCNDASAQNIDGCILYVWDGSNWVELYQTTNDDINYLTFSTAESEIASKLVDDSDSYIRLILRSRNARQGASNLTLNTYFVEIEINEDLDGVVSLSHKAILDNTGDVISVKNLTDNTELELTTHYTISLDRRSVVVAGQDSGDLIEVQYNRYFEVFFDDLPEHWLRSSNPNSNVERQLSLELKTISESI